MTYRNKPHILRHTQIGLHLDVERCKAIGWHRGARIARRQWRRKLLWMERVAKRARAWWGVDLSFGPPAQVTTVELADGTRLITHVNGTPLLKVHT